MNVKILIKTHKKEIGEIRLIVNGKSNASQLKNLAYNTAFLMQEPINFLFIMWQGMQWNARILWLNKFGDYELNKVNYTFAFHGKIFFFFDSLIH